MDSQDYRRAMGVEHDTFQTLEETRSLIRLVEAIPTKPTGTVKEREQSHIKFLVLNKLQAVAKHLDEALSWAGGIDTGIKSLASLASLEVKSD